MDNIEKMEIGRFSATTFSKINLEFIVYDNNTMDCPLLRVSGFKRIDLKPRFILTGGIRPYVYDVPAAHYYGVSHLISNYNINEELFEHLKQNKMIIYSVDMAYFYGFSDKDGFNVGRVRSPYKRAKKKGPILVKQKQGQFN